MSIAILGVLLIVAVFALSRSVQAIFRLKGILLAVGAALVVLGVLTSAVRQIEPGEIGVQVLFGSVQDQVLYEGLSLVNPFVDVRSMSIQTSNYTMSGVSDEGMKAGDDAIRVLSADGLEVTIDLTVLYRVIPTEAPNIVRRIGPDYQDKVVRPITRTRIRENSVYYTAMDLYSKRRDEFQKRISENIEKDFHSRGLVLENLLVRNISLPPSVKESIERKITAEQEAQRMEFVLAKGEQEAKLKRIEAEGVATAQRILSEALTDKILQYETIKMQKELASSPNSKIVIMNGKNTPPIFMNDK